MSKWTTNDIPDLSGKVIIVTGANSGIGYEAAKEFAREGAETILACRSMDKAQTAVNQILAEIPEAQVEIMQLDLASQKSVHQFADAFRAKYGRLDILVNNAGIMWTPYRKTEDGFESQFGTNHLGHFALTGLLLDLLLKTPGSRVVNVSSSTHRMGSGTIEFDNLNAENGYSAWGAYAQSKLANLLFTLELNEHFKAIDAGVLAVAAHPGWTATGLQRGLFKTVSHLIGQSPPMGALPTLRAAVGKDVQPGDYFGPGGFMEMRGYPKKVDSSAASKDEKLAQKLWQVSEEMTGVAYNWSNPIKDGGQSA